MVSCPDVRIQLGDLTFGSILMEFHLLKIEDFFPNFQASELRIRLRFILQEFGLVNVDDDAQEIIEYEHILIITLEQVLIRPKTIQLMHDNQSLGYEQILVITRLDLSGID